MPRRPLLIVSLALLAACGAAQAAAAQPAHAVAARVGSKIVLFKSIGGISLGATPKQIERRLGKPNQTIHVAHRIAEITYYKAGLSFQFDTLQRSDPADDVAAIGPRFHTAKGIHVGASTARVKHAYHGIHCNKYQCALYQGPRGAVGSRITTFTLFGGKVNTIQLQISYE
jgi:hypothetical protein